MRCRQLIVLALLVCYLPACKVWHVEQGLTPQQVIAARSTQAVQVRMADGSRRVFDHPHITGDSLVGQLHGSESHVAVADIARVASRRVSTLKTTLLVGSVAMFFLGAAAGQSLNESRGSREPWGWSIF